jgi:hypothetical protein
MRALSEWSARTLILFCLWWFLVGYILYVVAVGLIWGSAGPDTFGQVVIATLLMFYVLVPVIVAVLWVRARVKLD